MRYRREEASAAPVPTRRGILTRSRGRSAMPLGVTLGDWISAAEPLSQALISRYEREHELVVVGIEGAAGGARMVTFSKHRPVAPALAL